MGAFPSLEPVPVRGGRGFGEGGVFAFTIFCREAQNAGLLMFNDEADCTQSEGVATVVPVHRFGGDDDRLECVLGKVIEDGRWPNHRSGVCGREFDSSGIGQRLPGDAVRGAVDPL